MKTPKVLLIHRRYWRYGGEDSFLHEMLLPRLTHLGIDWELLEYPRLFSVPSNLLSDFIEVLLLGLGIEKWRPSYGRAAKLIRDVHYDFVLFNNFLPTLSLAIPRLCQQNGIGTIMWLHNSRLACANGIFYDGKSECRECLEKSSWSAFKKNCLRSFWQSLFYALAYRNRRIAKETLESINLFVCNSKFTAEKILKTTAGTLGKTGVLDRVVQMAPPGNPESVPTAIPSDLKQKLRSIPDKFYLYLGRISPEKGIDRVVEWAKQYPEYGFVVCSSQEEWRKLIAQSSNIVLIDADPQERAWLFANAQALLVPSRVQETASLVIVESHAYGTPIVYPPGGGAEETFLRLDRSGCQVGDFRGQRFERKVVVSAEIRKLRNQFDEDLRAIFQIL